MKKGLIMVLALIFVLGISCTAFAAVSPYSDVPADHWSYEAISKLTKAGIVSGYGDGTFRGDRTMTRYEMATIVANALTKMSKLDADNKALVDKLAQEFASELQSLDLRVTQLEKKAPNFKYYGDLRIRYQSNWTLAGTNLNNSAGTFRVQDRVRLGFISDVADNVSLDTRIIGEYRQSDSNNSTAAYNDQLEYDKFALTFKKVMPLSDFTIGRQFIQQGPGLMFSIGYIDAAKLTFGNTLKGYVVWGDARYAPGPTYDSSAAAAINSNAKGFFMVATQYPIEKNTNLYLSGLQSTTNGYNKKLLDFAFDTKVTPEIKLAAEFVRNTHSLVSNLPDKTAEWIGLYYKGANPKEVGSAGLFVNYRKIGANSTDPLLSYVLIDFVPWNSNGTFTSFKGISYGFNATVCKNVVFQLSMDQLRSYNGSIRYNDAVYAQINAYF